MFQCVMCYKDIPERLMFIHIPKCYVQICSELNFSPLCTCNSCKGCTQHLQEKSKKRMRMELNHSENDSECVLEIQSPSPKDLSNNPIEKMNNSINSTLNNINNNNNNNNPNNSSSGLVHNNTDRFELNVVLGRKCAVCGTKRSKSQISLPHVNVGKSCSFYLCKKQHLTDGKATVENLIKKIQAEIDLVVTGEEIEEDLCSGYPDINSNKDVEKCNKNTKKYLYLKEKKGEKYFCSPVHLINYITLQYCSRGR